MKYIKLFEEINSVKITADDNIDKNFNLGNFKLTDDIIKQMKDNEVFYIGIENFINRIKNIYNNGGILYRSLYLISGQKIDSKNIGEHYTISEENLFNIDETLFQGFEDEYSDEYDSKNIDWRDNMYVYHLFVKVPPKSIDIKTTILNYNYHEKEINLLKSANKEIIDIFRYNYDTNNMKIKIETKTKIKYV